jgi:hypothetical protein
VTTISKEAGLPINVLFAGVPVAELHAALAWYERLLGGPPDRVPNESERMWRLTDGAGSTSSPTRNGRVGAC